jgi:hypothetical protein
VPALRDGSLVHLGTYGGTIAPDQLRSVTLDPGTGVLTIEGLQLPLVELPFDERFEFATTGGTARVSEIGDVDMVLPVEMRDADGNATRLEMKLTTGTASTRVTHGVFFTRAGEPLGPEGDATLVGLATIPSGGLKGFAMEIVLNVHVDL